MTGWERRPFPGIDEEIARWTLDHPPGLATVRAALQRVLRDHLPASAADPIDLAERLLIVATELAGNALRHARPPTVVALLRADGHLIVDVIDNQPGASPVVDSQRRPGAGGLGLVLAEQLAEDVGWFPAGGRKHVWAQFTIPTGNTRASSIATS
jgi:anti-sigma regulatory factor (Ser/Thr protein kinase)